MGNVRYVPLIYDYLCSGPRLMDVLASSTFIPTAVFDGFTLVCFFLVSIDVFPLSHHNTCVGKSSYLSVEGLQFFIRIPLYGEDSFIFFEMRIFWSNSLICNVHEKHGILINGGKSHHGVLRHVESNQVYASIVLVKCFLSLTSVSEGECKLHCED